MKLSAIILLATILTIGCNQPEESTEVPRHLITRAEGRILDVDLLKPDGTVNEHRQLNLDPAVVQVMKCGPTKACVEAVSANYKPGVTPGEGGGGPIEGGGGGPIGIGGIRPTKEEICFVEYKDCMDDCYRDIPHLPPFAGLFLACVTFCSAQYVACQAAAKVGGWPR